MAAGWTSNELSTIVVPDVFDAECVVVATLVDGKYKKKLVNFPNLSFHCQLYKFLI